MNTATRFLLAACLAWSTTAVAQMPFQSSSFRKACNDAEKAGKFVMLVFHTNWCVNCKTLAATTFKDKRVLDWIEQKTIPISVNADVNRTLAQRFFATTYPTILLMTPDADEFFRIHGYLSADRFLEVAQKSDTIGQNVVAAKRELIAAGRNNPAARIKYAGVLLDNGLPPKALDEMVWCYDHGGEYDASFRGAGRSRLLGDIVRLAHTFPPAADAVRTRHAALRERLLGDRATVFDAIDLAMVNRSAGRSADTLTLYDRIRAERPDSPSVKFLRDRVFDALRAARRYAEIAKSTDVRAKVGRILDRHRTATTTALSSVPEDQREAYLEAQHDLLIHDVTGYYEVLFGLPYYSAAAEVASDLLRVSRTADVYHALAASGLRTGKANAETLDQAQKAFDMTSGEDATIVDTLARIRAELGRTPN